MLEPAATLVITASSALLFAYWVRCAYLLFRSQNTGPEFGDIANRRRRVSGLGTVSNGPLPESVQPGIRL
jgi:hypothetical protein